MEKPHSIEPPSVHHSLPGVLAADRDDWNLIKEKAKVAISTGMLPRHITTPQQAAIIALKGRELGIPFMQAMASIYVIEGKPSLSAELMLALIYRQFPQAKVLFKTPPDKAHLECTIEAARPGQEAQIFRFTLEDAKKAGLLSKANWVKYPAALLRARCISAMGRAVFPDATQACHTPEELGAEVIEGEVIWSSTADTKKTSPQETETKPQPPPLVTSESPKEKAPQISPAK